MSTFVSFMVLSHLGRENEVIFDICFGRISSCLPKRFAVLFILGTFLLPGRFCTWYTARGALLV